MARQFVARGLALGLALAAFGSAELAMAEGTDTQPIKAFADRFLSRLDSGDVNGAYEMINQSLRANYPLSSLSQARGQRVVKGAARRVFVAVRPMPTPRGAIRARARVLGATLSIVCYTEPPRSNFQTLSYTAVTVSQRTGNSMWIENFQTTSTPHSACQ